MQEKGEQPERHIGGEIATMLLQHGVRHVVVSPGSRNAPLIVGVARSAMVKHVVVDERSAAFMALGMARRMQEPVALVCTSGTALLNYAPAIAEAYYTHVPLVVVSADRPAEWIDQDDSQTIRQDECLRAITKRTFNLRSDNHRDTPHWYNQRTVNEAVICATTAPQAPVHINVPLEEPLYGEPAIQDMEVREIAQMPVKKTLSENMLGEMAGKIEQSKKVLIVATMMLCSDVLRKAMLRLKECANVTIIHETLANLGIDEGTIPTVDRVLKLLPKSDGTAPDAVAGTLDDYQPDLLITMGGAPISRLLKAFCRGAKCEHWRVAEDHNLIDTMQNLTAMVPVSPEYFLAEMATRINKDRCAEGYQALWMALRGTATVQHEKYVESVAWSDLKAFSLIMPSVPCGCDLQLSNGTAVRYAQMFACQARSQMCNRGVSGIDGSTSTALGASLVSDALTLLITGDMSAAYDLSGLASQYNHKNFKIIVMANGGGGIFRFIKGPSDLPELETYFEVKRDVPFERYAMAFGWKSFSASNEEELRQVLSDFYACQEPAMLVVNTPGEESAKVMRNYFNPVIL